MGIRDTRSHTKELFILQIYCWGIFIFGDNKYVQRTFLEEFLCGENDWDFNC